MSSFTIVFQPEAVDRLDQLYDHIATSASPDIAARYTQAIVTLCQGLRDFPHQGTRRDDIRPGVRTMSYRKRTVIAFSVGIERVDILGIFYGGQNWQAALAD